MKFGKPAIQIRRWEWIIGDVYAQIDAKTAKNCPCPSDLHYKDNITELVNYVAMKSFYGTSITFKDPAEKWIPYQKSDSWQSVCSEGNANGTIHICQTSVRDLYLLEYDHPSYIRDHGELNPHFKLDYLQFMCMFTVDYEGNARPFLPKCFMAGKSTSTSKIPGFDNDLIKAGGAILVTWILAWLPDVRNCHPRNRYLHNMIPREHVKMFSLWGLLRLLTVVPMRYSDDDRDGR
ncbi:hypothetical protein ACTXT7_011233 [Hymenolepis weldensis]